MSGITHMLIGFIPGGTTFTHKVTVGVGSIANGNGTAYGFNVLSSPDTGPIGSITPSTYEGITIGFAQSAELGGNPTVDFQFQLETTTTQDFFTSIIVVDGTGAERLYNTADASSWNTSAGRTTWFWNDSQDPVWVVGDAGKVRGIKIIP